jgi:hypothetical protein
MATKAWHLPVRLATGVFILNSGLGKQQVDSERAKRLQSMAAHAFPQLGEMEPERFVKLLSTGEIALGAALIAVPVVPPLVAGLGLLGFSAGLNQMYLKAPGLRREGSVRPTEQGTAIAKDIWMTSIGAALVLDSLFSPKRRR